MRTITAFEAETRFGELLERVARGEEIVITRHDRAVARIVPERHHTLAQTRQAVAALDELRARIARRTRSAPDLSDADVREAIDEGRR